MAPGPEGQGGPPHRVPGGLFDRSFGRMARWLLARGVRPNHVTFLQVPFLAGEVWAAWNGHALLFVGLVWFVIFLDGLDGVLARAGGLQSRSGALLDAAFDTIGIFIVLWGTGLFFPEARWWLFGLFGANILLYLQNAVVEQKAVSYVRGPVLVAVVFPQALLGALVLGTVIVGWQILLRVPVTVRRVAKSTA